MVPPVRSAGVQRPSRAVAVRPAKRAGELGHGQRVRVLDVRDDQAPLRRGGEAQVHVVPDDDLLGLLIPDRIDHRMTRDRHQQRPGHEQQRGDPQPGEFGQLADAPQRGHRLGDVDVEELRHVRGGERAGHHGRGDVLPDAADRDALLARDRRAGPVTAPVAGLRRGRPGFSCRTGLAAGLHRALRCRPG